MAIHPPAVYASEKGRLIIPTADTPEFDTPYWIGVAVVKERIHYLELASWHDLRHIPPHETLAFAVLMGKPVSWEYPSTGEKLLEELDRAGLSRETLYTALEAAAIITTKGDPIHFILGAPMRGIVGQKLNQHLSVWHIEDKNRDDIVAGIESERDTTEMSEIKKRIQNLSLKILSLSPIIWCPVIEARAETTIRRDAESPLGGLRGKSVVLWGCGALGSFLATMLCRAGVKAIQLWDPGIVTPGILVRQDFCHSDIGRLKVEAIADRLIAINPAIVVTANAQKISFGTGAEVPDWTQEADIVIDATASAKLRLQLEMIWNQSPRRVPVGSVMVDQNAEIAIVGIVPADSSGGTWDLYRKAKIECLRRAEFQVYADAFFPNNPRPPFQPEPGCSDATFRGSAADSMTLAAAALNLISRTLSQSDFKATAHIFHSPLKSAPRTLEFTFQHDIVSDAGSYELRVSPTVIKEAKATIAQNKRVRGFKNETGGLLWGEWDEAMKIVWISDASGPPPDSNHSPELFVCGTIGTAEEASDRRRYSRASVNYIGMWHTHPVSAPQPSEVDFLGMGDILLEGGSSPRNSLLMIFGKHSGKNVMGNYIFQRHEFGEKLKFLTCAPAWHVMEQTIL